MKTYSRIQDAKITGIFIPIQPGEQHDPLILLHAIPVKKTAESMMAHLNDEKWEAFRTGRLRHMTRKERIRHDREYNEYKKLLDQAKELMKPFLN